ncbi:hypothetical protein ACROYT_G027743 [Oculina patagonica]
MLICVSFSRDARKKGKSHKKQKTKDREHHRRHSQHVKRDGNEERRKRSLASSSSEDESKDEPMRKKSKRAEYSSSEVEKERTLFVCDSGNKVIRMITNGKPFKKLSDVFYKYAELFNLDHYRGPPRFSFDQGISIIDNVVAFLLTWGEETRERTGRTATQGPDQIIPHCTRRSFQLIHI